MSLAFTALWLDTLAVCLLWATVFTPRRDGDRPPLIGRFLFGALRPIPLLGLLLAAVLAFTMQFKINAGPRWFAFVVSLIIAYFVVRMVSRLFRATPPSRALAGAALLLAISLGALILQQIASAVETRCRLLSNEALAQYVAGLPPYAGGPNAADIYARLLPKLAEDQPKDLHNTPLGDSETFDPHEPATHAYLQRNAGMLQQLRRATTLPCRFEQDLGQPDLSRLEHLNPVRNAANAFSLHARQALADGDVNAAVDDAAAVLRFSDQHGHRPLLINALVAIGVRALGYDLVERSLPAVTSHQQLAAVRLDELTPPDVMYRRMLIGEKRYGLSMYGGWNRMDLFGSGISGTEREHRAIRPVQSLLTRVFIFRPDDYVQLIDRVSELSHEPNYKVRREVSSFYAGHATNDLMANILAPSLGHSLEVCGVIAAHESCLRVAMAMTAYRLDHGALPASLGDLVPAYLPAVPTDPFSGEPVKLVRRDNEWRVYSVGQDATDDGGVDDNTSKKRDVVVRLRDLAATTQP